MNQIFFLGRLSVIVIEGQIIGLSTAKGSEKGRKACLNFHNICRITPTSSPLFICKIFLKVVDRFRSYKETTSFETICSAKLFV